MKLNSGYELLRASPLATAVILALGCSSSAWSADLGPGESAVVDSTSPVENWNLTNALLDVEPQGATGAINAAYGSALNINGGSASASGIAVNLLNSDAEISGATLTSTRSTGLAVNRNGDFIDPASTAFVSDSTISGVGRGVVVSFESTLQLARTTVTGALNQNGAGTGIMMLDGAVSLEDNTRVTGQVNGIQMASEVLPTPADVGILAIDASSVTGTTGSAILIAPLNSGGRPSNAQINISNGSTLQGGNGLAIEVNRASSALVQVQGSTLLGGILVDETSTADVVLDEGSTLTGDVTNVANFTLNNQSTMTGNLTGTDVLTVSNNSSITGDVSEVQTFSLAGNSLVQGNLTNVANVALTGASAMTGNLVNTDILTVSENSSITGDVSEVQRFNVTGNSLVDGNLTNVANVALTGASAMTGNLVNTDILAVSENSSITGDVSEVRDFTLAGNSLVQGNLTNVAEFTMNQSSLTGNLTGTTVLTASDNSQITGDVSEVQKFILSENSLVDGNLTNVAEFTMNRSSMTGNLTGTTALTAGNNSQIIGDVSEVQNFLLTENSLVEGNLTNVAEFTMNRSSLTGNLTGTAALTASDNSQITGDVSEVQKFILSENSLVDGNLTNVAEFTMSRSRMTGNLTGTTALTAGNNSQIIGDVSDVQTFTMADASSMVGNLTNVDTFALSNGSSMSGNLTGTRALTASDGSSVTGNVSDVQLFTLAGNSSVAGNLKNVDTLSLDNSTWTTGDGQGVTHLTMNAGTVKLGSANGTIETLNISSLSGSGRFIMDTNLGAQQSDLISVSGQATGSYDLQIGNTGVEPVKGGPDQQVVHTGAGSTAGFAVIGGQVDFGTFAYQLEQRANGADTDWYLVQKLDDEGEPIPTPGTRSVIGLFSAAPTVWYGELTTLRSRMGELRYGKTEGGVWSRAYGNKYNMSAAGGTAYQQNQQGITFGADTPLKASGAQWLIGVLGGYSRSDLNIAAGTSGQVDSYYLGAYTTWLSDSGYYIDAVVKANRFKNKADVRMSDGGKSKGDYNASGIGASVEAGKHIKLRDDWFVEPFAQISTLWVQGKDYSLNNGMDASSNQADSLLGKVGTTVGRNFPLDKGGYVQPYVKVAFAHEFANSNRVKVNDTTFSNDLSGGRGELGAGVAAQLTDVLQVHADVEYSNGKNIEQPWGVNVGVRYSW